MDKEFRTNHEAALKKCGDIGNIRRSKFVGAENRHNRCVGICLTVIPVWYPIAPGTLGIIILYVLIYSLFFISMILFISSITCVFLSTSL